MAHTPGPWAVREPEGDGLHEIYAENGGDLICFPVWTHNQKANIPLIAAAPEMLGFLHQIADECKRRLRKGKDSGDLLTLQLCRAAISKAEGLTKEGSDGEDRRVD
jgi:hypothetical protein